MSSISSLELKEGWTLFLDRDGVINRRIPDGYVKSPGQFEFLPGVLEAIKIFTGIFDRIIIVTNQQGIGRGLMTSKELEEVHSSMKDSILKAGGKIDAIYYCPDLRQSGSFMRKPAVGMGLKARKDFPAIRFHKSIMAGDTFSDMLFGKRLGMVNALIGAETSEIKASGEIPDYLYPDLISFARDLPVR
ncbi:MAG: HAD-IIIA family hydrolase [Bacteroidetes bacterium]|nr:HAD-IIIA family hydrolase [Bacteroidota bacterium]